MKLSQKASYVGLVAALLFSALPLHAQAQTTCPTLSAGDVFKVPDLSTVYMVNESGERMFFPSTDVYYTWYTDFSGVVTIDPTCVVNYPAPAAPPFGVTYRTGSRLVTTPLTNNIYAILPGNQIQEIGNETVAQGLYGANWGSLVRDVPEVYWNDYQRSNDVLTELVPHDGMLVTPVTNQNVYIVDDGMLGLLNPSEIPRYAQSDIRTFSDSILDRFDVDESSSDSLFQQTPSSPGEPTIIGEVIIDNETFDQVQGESEEFTILQPEDWDMVDETDVDDLIDMFGVDVSAAQTQLLDFTAFQLDSGDTTALIGVIAQPLKGDKTGILDVVQRLQFNSPTLVDEVFANSGLTLNFGTTESVFVDGSFGNSVTATLSDGGTPVWNYTFVDVARAEQYFIVFVTDVLNASEHEDLFDTVLENFEFND